MNSMEILERLIGFPTVSRDSNLGLIDFVRQFLSARGIDSRLYMDDAGGKANLYACIGPRDRGGVLLSGHTDVVPVDGQAWSSDPFRLQRRADRLYARGSADMKAFLACALRAADLANRRALAVPLQLAFSYDEEVGCLGVRSLLEDMASWAHRPKFCIVGEPTLMRTAVGHKGKTAMTARCHGRAAHSARPAAGVNAIHLAVDFIDAVRSRQAQIELTGMRDPAYEVPYTTLHVGVIHGGSALNIVPDRCDLELEIRNLAADDPALLVAALRADAAAVSASMQAGPDSRIDLDVDNEYPGLETPPDAPLVEFVAALTGNRERIKVGFGSEAGLFSGRLGIPSVVCGPGSIDQAHKPDEFIAVDQVERCDAMLDALLLRLA
ncbi:MAG: acetylornithine deacetylase [Steroidobacteraceae bacterium]|jgi:acetylornithine deacetylase